MRCLSLHTGILLLMLGLCGCGSLHGPRHEHPLRQPLSPENLPANAQFTATLSLTRQEVKEDYILALRTGDGSYEGAFLTAQGIPVLSVDYWGGKMHVSRQAAIGSLLAPRAVMGYLALIYSTDRRVESTLGKYWSWEMMDTSERRFSRTGADGEHQDDIFIHYSGTAPWYQVVELMDKGSDLTLSIRVLEYNNAVLE